MLKMGKNPYYGFNYQSDNNYSGIFKQEVLRIIYEACLPPHTSGCS